MFGVLGRFGGHSGGVGIGILLHDGVSLYIPHCLHVNKVVCYNKVLMNRRSVVIYNESSIENVSRTGLS